MRSDAQRLALTVAVLVGAVALFVVGFLIVVGVRSVVAEPGSAPGASPPNPGHSWSEIGELPGTMWHSNNDGPGSGLDADTLDGLQSTQIQDADDYVSTAGYCTASGDADTLDGAHASAFASVSHVHDDRYYTETELQTSGSASVHWDNLGSVPAGFADDVDNDVLGGLSCANGEIAKWNGSAWQCAADDTGTGSFWSLTGNSGTTPGTNFLGTTDNQALELRVNNARALRLEPNPTSPNVIGGYTGNSVTAGAVGATICGGGTTAGINQVTNGFATIGGGSGNVASGWATVGGGQTNAARGSYSTVGGGYSNTASGSSDSATIGGGRDNRVWGWAPTIGGGWDNLASADFPTVGGGHGNTASGDYATVSGGVLNAAVGVPFATVGGGYLNTASAESSTVGGGYSNTASGQYATVPGGQQNTAQGDYSLAVGYRAKANHQGAFVWADSTDADFASTTADQFLVRASGGVGLNVTSGALRLEPATDFLGLSAPNLIGGHSGNSVTTGVAGATIAGGRGNRATDEFGTVGGGNNNQAGTTAGTTIDAQYATVAGGVDNTANGWAATIGGGGSNWASGYGATVGGGGGGTASGDAASVGGGDGNTASGYGSVIAGGAGNTASEEYATVGGGAYNTASGQGSVVGGGSGNTASGYLATVPGGSSNSAAGSYSFAAGNAAQATDQGSFVWSSNESTSSWGNNTFTVRSQGGAKFYTASGTGTGVQLAAGGSSWSSLSDRNQKENFTPVDGQQVLALLADMPISTWNLKSQDESIRHMGPMAQDFSAAFGLGEDERYINTQDADGVALVAIQGLYQLSQEQAARIDALEEENADLKARVDDLDARVSALEGGAGTSAASAEPAFPGLSPWWLALLGGLLLVGLVVVQRRRAGGRP